MSAAIRIAFVNPPLRTWRFSRSQRSPGVIKSGTLYYPYWLAHAAALAEENGHDILLVDAAADELDRQALIDSLRSFGPDLVVVETSTPSINHDLETIGLLREAIPAMRCCATGTHVTAEWRAALEGCAGLDYVAIGEYDYTILELANRLAAREDGFGLPGLAWRDDGKPTSGPPRPLIADMNALPWIAPLYKRFLKPSNYLFTIANQPMVMLISGRGCRARCFFCVYPQVMHGHDYRTRSPEDVVGEMKWIQDNMPEVKEIVFEDDTFTSDRERARRIADLVKQEGVTMPWFANIRVNVDFDTLAALKDAGLRQCATGFESGDETLLVNMRKGQTLEQQYEFVENCRKLGILVHGCFMVGFPGETHETLEKTLDLAIRLNPDSAQFYPVMPYPGTGAYKWAQENGYLLSENFDDWLKEDGGHRCIIDLPGLSAADLQAFCERAFRRFHFRPKYLARKLLQAVTMPSEGLRSLNAGLNFAKSIVHGSTPDGAVPLTPERMVDENWHSRVRVPRGRMEDIAASAKAAPKDGAGKGPGSESLGHA